MNKQLFLPISLLLVAVLFVDLAFGQQNINNFFQDMANQTQSGQSGVKLLAGRILGIILIIVLAIAIGLIWIKPEYSKGFGVAFIIGAVVYWACVQANWLAV